MKILFISNIAASEIGSFSIASIEAAHKIGLEFHIAANFKRSSPEQREKDEIKHNIKIHHIDFVRNPLHIQNITALKQLINIIKKEKIDVIHCNTPTGGIYGRLAGRVCGVKKIIYQAHGFHFYKGAPYINWIMFYPAERILARVTDVIITINQEDYERAKKFHLRNSGRVYYVPGVGIDISKYIIDRRCREEKRTELGIPSKAIILISVGELNVNKNNTIILSALGKIKSQNIHYVLCGVGNMEESLKEEAQKFGIAENIHFLGYRSDIPQLLAASDIFVLPSLREGLSRSLMEAMACGLPCLASNIRGNVDLIEDGKGGFLIPVNNADIIAKKIQILARNTTIRKKMAERNLIKIKEFDLSRVVDILITIYKKELL